MNDRFQADDIDYIRYCYDEKQVHKLRDYIEIVGIKISEAKKQYHKNIKQV